MLNVVPVPVRINATRTSLRARARRTNLSYFSYSTGVSTMNADRNMPAIVTNSANPVSPARRTARLGQFESAQTEPKQRTWSNMPFGLKARNTRETRHGKEVEKDLGCRDNNGRLGNNHLTKNMLALCNIHDPRNLQHPKP